MNRQIAGEPMTHLQSEHVGQSAAEEQAIRQREELIVGKPPRLEPLTSQAAIDTAIQITQDIRKASGSPTPVSAADVPELMTTLLRHPDLYRRIADLSMQLLGKGVLTPRDRQLAIMRVSWLRQAPYVWGEHVKNSKRAGLTSDELEQVTRGSTAPGWNEHERAILRAVEELHQDAMISDDTWEGLSKLLNDQQLIELLTLVGQFSGCGWGRGTSGCARVSGQRVWNRAESTKHGPEGHAGSVPYAGTHPPV
jgi:4-carboxymuconolactone decarboxylase